MTIKVLRLVKRAPRKNDHIFRVKLGCCGKIENKRYSAIRRWENGTITMCRSCSSIHQQKEKVRRLAEAGETSSCGLWTQASLAIARQTAWAMEVMSGRILGKRQVLESTIDAMPRISRPVNADQAEVDRLFYKRMSEDVIL